MLGGLEAVLQTIQREQYPLKCDPERISLRTDAIICKRVPLIGDHVWGELKQNAFAAAVARQQE